MRNPIRVLFDALERRFMRKLIEVQKHASAEAFEMFDGWWEERAKVVVEAGARRMLKDEEAADDFSIEVLVSMMRMTAQHLAIDVRAKSASILWLEGVFPKSSAAHEHFVDPIREDDPLITEMFESISNFGINPDWLRSHFAV